MDISGPPISCFLGMTEALIVIFGGAFLREMHHFHTRYFETQDKSTSLKNVL
jgi:hypothetical protein